MKFSVLTTIQAPTACTSALVSFGNRFNIPVLAIGDRKSPECTWPSGCEFLSLAQQQKIDSRLARLLPVDHYSRKNIGYLVAVSRGATLLFDTDDDNAPLPHWQPRRPRTEAIPIDERGWVNAYRWFSSDFIWPRGFPLESLQKTQTTNRGGVSAQSVECPIQQGLVNGSPDVDAVWRLIFDRAFNFDQAPSIWLKPGTWCPFNSQSTWWFQKAFPLLYLPSFVSFRMTDIWRSFIAQRCLWEIDYGIAFHAPESIQHRNMHNLLRDFEQEVPGYLNNNRIIEILEELQLESGVNSIPHNMHRCYEALISADIVPKQEIPLVEAWINDLEVCRTTITELADQVGSRPN